MKLMKRMKENQNAFFMLFMSSCECFLADILLLRVHCLHRGVA